MTVQMSLVGPPRSCRKMHQARPPASLGRLSAFLARCRSWWVRKRKRLSSVLLSFRLCPGFLRPSGALPAAAPQAHQQPRHGAVPLGIPGPVPLGIHGCRRPPLDTPLVLVSVHRRLRAQLQGHRRLRPPQRILGLRRPRCPREVDEAAGTGTGEEQRAMAFRFRRSRTLISGTCL